MLSILLLTLSLGATPTDSVRPDADVREVALHHTSEIQQCYEANGLRVNPSLSGTIEVSATVLPDGRVDTAVVSRSELHGAGRGAVESCITMAVRNWRYDRGPFGTEIVVYPFTLQRDDSRLLRTVKQS